MPSNGVRGLASSFTGTKLVATVRTPAGSGSAVNATGRTTVTSPDIDRMASVGPPDPMLTERWPRPDSMRPPTSELSTPIR